MSFDFFILCVAALGVLVYWIHEAFKETPNAPVKSPGKESRPER